MTRSPQRLLATGFIICILLGLVMDLINKNPNRYLGLLAPQFPTNNEHDLSLARYYWNIGDFDKAVTEYQRVIPSLPKEQINPANRELEKLLLFEKSTRGRIIGGIAYYSWSLPAKLYELAFIFFLISIFLFVYRHVKKAPKFVIQNFYDHAGLNIGGNLPQIAVDRIHEITWRAQNLEAASNLIADNIEIPTLSLVSEGDNQSATELLEIALMFSIGSNNLPFSHMISAIRLWLEQPRYLVRGVIDKRGESISLKISMLDRKKNSIEKTWQIEMPCAEFTVSKVVDAVIYPLLYHFNNISATRWEALQALHIGLEEFQLFKDDQSALNHLRFAQQQFEHALALDPEYGLAKYNLSLLLLAMGEFEKARDFLKELSALSKDPQLRLKANYNYGVALFLMSQDWAYEQAVKIFEELLDKNDDKQLALLIQSAVAITYAKMSGRRPGEKGSLVSQSLDEADKVLEEIETLKKRNKSFDRTHTFKETAANALAAKGYAYTASEEFEQAIEYFKQAVKLNPGNITSILGLGEAYLRNGRRDEALVTFKKAAIQSPMSGYTNYRLGNLYRELGEHDEAINVLKRASQHAHARLTLGKIYLEDEDFEKALDEFREATHINSRLSEAWINIAWSILQMEDKDLLKEAVKAARRSLQLEKNEKQVWHRHAVLAFSLIKADKASQAISEAMKAVELAPNQPQAHYYLALAQNKLGQNTKARYSVKKTIDLDKKGIWTSSAVNLLNELPKETIPSQTSDEME